MQPGGHTHFKANQVAALTFPFTSCSRQPWPLGHGGFEHYVLQKWHLSSKSVCLQVQFCLLRNPGRLSVSFSRASASWALCSSGSYWVLFSHAFKGLKKTLMLFFIFLFEWFQFSLLYVTCESRSLCCLLQHLPAEVKQDSSASKAHVSLLLLCPNYLPLGFSTYPSSF